MLDVAIIGAGPAGLSAAINLHLRKKEFIWFGTCNGSDKVEKTEQVYNYPGLGIVSGAQLNAAFRAHAAQLEIAPVQKKVTLILPTETGYSLLAENDIYDAKTVLLATGMKTSKELEGEAQFLGRGVSYCATCDGFFYKEKTIAVLCTAAHFADEVKYLAELAKKVYLYPAYAGCDIALPNVEIVASPFQEVKGGFRAETVLCKDGTVLAVDGLFCLRDSVAPAMLLQGLAMEGACIRADRACATNLPGVFAAGDCIGGPYQIAKAVGEGNVAAHSVVAYLAKK